MAPVIANQHILKLTPYVPGKPVEEVERELGISDTVKLASNENPLGPSAKALEAARKALEDIRMYPEGSCYVLRKKLARHLDVREDMLSFGAGADEVIHGIGLAFLSPDDEVLTSETTFVQYRAAAMLAGAHLVEVPLRNHTYDLDALADAVTPRTRLVFIANPNNPTGTSNTAEEVERLLGKLPDRALLVLDEAYFEYVDSPDYPVSIDYVRQGANVVVLRTFSKIYALAGLRVGYGVSTPEITNDINRVRLPFNVNSVAQHAAAASLDDPEHVKRGRRINRQGKDQFYEAFRKLGLDWVPSQANFVWVDVNRDSTQVVSELLRRGVIVRPGSIFNAPSFVRVTIGTAEDNERFLRALEEVLS